MWLSAARGGATISPSFSRKSSELDWRLIQPPLVGTTSGMIRSLFLTEVWPGVA